MKGLSAAATRPAGFCRAATAMRSMLALFAVLILAGCAGPERTGASLDALNKRVGLPRPGQARVVVLRSKEFHFFDVGWKVFLDQVAMGDLKTGTFVYG